jgi:lysine 2,3-aminomutase
MAGTKDGGFRELISPFLKVKLEQIAGDFGKESQQYEALSRQYVRSQSEDIIRNDSTRRHYESEVHIEFEGRPVIGVERLYRRTVLLEPTTVCAAHCRWCLRGQYPTQTMKEVDIRHAARYIGSNSLRDDVEEVLITGGDPLMSQPLLRRTLTELCEHAPNVKIVRIGTRVPFQQPDRINGAMVEMFESFKSFRLELGVNVNHPVEFWPESIGAIQKLQDAGLKIYNQNPLLKGVNDDFETLVKLYELLRSNGIEAHYLFHAIPMRGMHHHRTSLAKGLRLANQLSSCGEFSGRAKPRYAVLSDIGKIVIYQDTIVDRDEKNGLLLLRSGFNLKRRMDWNPSWKIPGSVVMDDDGTMLVWYVDGSDDD